MKTPFPVLACALLSLLCLPWQSSGATPAAGPASPDYAPPVFLRGTVCSPETKQVLFNFTRTATNAGSTLQVQRDFTYPDGKLAVRERAVYEENTLTSYELEEVQTGASGRATLRHTPGNPAKGSIQFEYTAGAGSRPKTRSEDLQPDTLIGDMIGPFLASHWTALQRGEKVKCRYIVVPRAETVGFTFTKVSDENHGGQPAVSIKMEASSPFIAALVDPLFFTLEQAPPHRVLQYLGRTTPKHQVGGKWKDLDALTFFDWNRAR